MCECIPGNLIICDACASLMIAQLEKELARVQAEIAATQKELVLQAQVNSVLLEDVE